MKRTVVFGGTFNPFHIGHYEILSALCERQEIEKVLIMPDKIPPHKECEYLAPDIERIEMCKIAASDFKKAEICDLEFKREGKSYTFDTIKELANIFPDALLAICCGGDMMATLDTWYRGLELIRLVPFYVFRRAEDSDFSSNAARLKAMGANIIIIEKCITDVSSTQLRRELKAGISSGLLPEKIEAYIKKRRLYV